MKKRAILAMVLVLLLAFTACGAKEAVQGALKDALDGSTAPAGDNDGGDAAGLGDAVQDMVDDAIAHNAFSLAAAANFWKVCAGLEVDAAAPDWDWVVDEEKMTTYGDTTDSSYGHASIAFEKAGGGEVSEEEYRAWAQKLFNATAAASDDGHNIIGWEFVGEGEDGFGEVSFDRAFDSWMPGWGFMVNGRNMVVYLDEKYDTDKESTIGRALYNYAVAADICYGMQASMDDLWGEMEDVLDEYEDEIKDALDDYT